MFTWSKRLLVLFVLIRFGVGSGTLIQADSIIHESATFGTGPGAPFLLAENQFLGSRFHLTDSMSVTQIGGHILGFPSFDPACQVDCEPLPPDPLFGAVVRLTGPGAFPLGSPFTLGEVLATTTFTPTEAGSDLLVPLSVILSPGDYALIFGAGLFGSPATATGGMLSNNTDLPGFSYFFWDSSVLEWRPGDFRQTRFVVRGDPADLSEVPEPATVFLLGSGLVGLAVRRRNKSFPQR
jgi:hypothetical protein